MVPSALPFQPFRQALYTPGELLHGLDPARPETLSRMTDFRIYRYWVKQGRYKPNSADGMMQALHDNSISQCVGALVAKRRVVGIMGGHAEDRDTAAFRAVAQLARQLTQAGYFVASGGGPGIMEAAHVGAFFAKADNSAFDAALATLAATPKFPDDAGAIVDHDGTVDVRARANVFAWLKPALTLRDSVQMHGESLGIPTWRYGHEPTSIFATHIAKYFENSVREDGLLSIARNGIVYAKGGSGTLQEIFQDAVFNDYFDDDLPPSPMIFFGRAHWDKVPVIPILKGLFGDEKFARFVSVTDDIDEILATLDAFAREKDACHPRARRGLAVSNPVIDIDRLEPEGGAPWAI